VPVVRTLADCTDTAGSEWAAPPVAATQSSTAPVEPRDEPEEKKSKRRGAFIALGAAAGAAAGLGLLSGGGEETPSTEPEPPQPPEPPSPPPIPPSAAVEACFELPASERVGVPVRVDASCSSPRGSIAYSWRLGDGRTREGRVINPIYRTPGLYIVELTVSRLETSGQGGEGDVDRLEKPILIIAGAPAAPPDGAGAGADLAVSKSGLLTSKIVDGVLEFHIAYTLQVTNLGPNPAGSVELRDPLAADLTITSLISSTGSCAEVARVVTCDLGTLASGGVATVRLDVDVRPGVAENTVVINTATAQSAAADPAPANNQVTETTVLLRPSPLVTGRGNSWSESPASFVSTLISPRGDGSTSGTIRIGESYSDIVNDTASFHHRFRPGTESVVVEAVVQGTSGESRWRFDFSSDPRFAPGSLVVLRGEVLGLDGSSIDFRLGGQPGERIRFSYRLYH
jgi:uncharacterized repeat protein (TIGR01451 family)